MSLSYTIDHLETAVEDVSVQVAAKSQMVFAGNETDPKTGEISTSYILASGDASFPSYVTYRSGTLNRKGGPMHRISCTLSTWAVKTDSVSGLDTRKEISGTISFNIPADLTTELADINVFAGNLFSFLYEDVTTKLRNTGWLLKLHYGATQVV